MNSNEKTSFEVEDPNKTLCAIVTHGPHVVNEKKLKDWNWL